MKGRSLGRTRHGSPDRRISPSACPSSPSGAAPRPLSVSTNAANTGTQAGSDRTANGKMAQERVVSAAALPDGIRQGA